VVRKLRESDIPLLKEIHAQSGFSYSFPDLLSDEFVDVEVRTDEHDRPVMAVAARKTVEVYLWVDNRWRTPRWRMAALVEIHEAARARLAELGFRDLHSWLPPQVAKAFGRRLSRVFGWAPSRWQCWSRRTEP
jgi:hypothetical protein